MPPKKRSARTPPPPRRQTGPQRRDTRQAPGWYKLAVLGGVAVVALAVVVVAVAWLGRAGSGRVPVEQAMATAGCAFKTYPDQGQQHVASYDAKVKYNSFPPTSGTHHQTPVIWGAYEDVVPAVAEVHNLEHGGVIIHYGDQVDASTRERLRAFYDDSPNGMLLAPLPRLGSKVSLTAWTKLATCQGFDEKAFSAFRSAYRGNGPERFRVGDLQPGT